jgi:SH3-like domain-containing protein
MIRSKILLPLLALCAFAAPVRAADDDKVPYWASIDADVANMRVGPGESYRIVWVYRRMHLPVKVLRREGPWRQVEDIDGDKGWMRDLLLSRQRAAIVTGDGLAEIHAEASDSARMLWRLEPGVTGLLGDCQAGWCAFDADGHKGFVREDRLWGAGAP